MPVLIGADPEFFLKEKRTRRNISAHGLVPGTKDKPHKLRYGAIQLDGTAVEFNIAPAKNSTQFIAHVNTVLDQIRKLIPEKYDFNFSPTVKYGPKYFDSIPDDCKELGCNPDHDAYKDGALNPIPEQVGTLRTGAGHIHIGFTKDANVKDPSHMVDCIWITRNFDALIKPIEYLWDKDNLRRSMYGKHGAFRPKPYGVEYRALSNAWVRHPELYDFIYHTAKYAHRLCELGYVAEERMPAERMLPRTYNTLLPYLFGNPLIGLHKLPETIKGLY